MGGQIYLRQRLSSRHIRQKRVTNLTIEAFHKAANCVWHRRHLIWTSTPPRGPSNRTPLICFGGNDKPRSDGQCIWFQASCGVDAVRLSELVLETSNARCRRRLLVNRRKLRATTLEQHNECYRATFNANILSSSPGLWKMLQ